MLKSEQRKPQEKIFSPCYSDESVGFCTWLKNRFQSNRDKNLPVHIFNVRAHKFRDSWQLT